MRSFLLLPFLFLFACSQPEDTSEKVEDEVKDEAAEIDSTADSEEKDTSEVLEVITKSEAEAIELAENYDSDEYEDLDWLEYEKSLMKDFSFVIIISTKSYDAALTRAKDASEKLGYPLNLRGLHPNDEMGLSLPEEVCEAICGGDVVDYPQYLPRNDWGEDKYVSVEYSNGFAGFTKGYYIVVVASGEKGDPIINEALNEAKKFYKDAYAKTCGVWMGCGC